MTPTQPPGLRADEREALRPAFEKAFMAHYTNGAHLLERFDTGHYRSEEARAAWRIASELRAALTPQPATSEERDELRQKLRTLSVTMHGDGDEPLIEIVETAIAALAQPAAPVAVPADLCERICAAIKAADDKSMDEAGYMLDCHDCIRIIREHFAASPQAAPAASPFIQPVSGDKLWLWQNGHKLLAYRHEYPCYSPGGDPCVLGEPVAEAEYRESYDRSCAP